VRVVLGVSGGIAAYKACELLRRFTESGHDVTVVPTAAALEFVGAPTWSALSGKPVATDVWTSVHEVPHVRIGQGADLVVVAPATADLLAKAAHGLADDLLTNTLLTARCPVVFAPAMHTEMWEHPATQANVATLRARGALVIEPAEGRLTGADTGKGRLPEPGEIFETARALLARTGSPTLLDLAGRRVVVSAGCRATRWRAPPPPAAPRSPWWPRTPTCPTRPGSRWYGWRAPASSARRCSPRRAAPTPW
jgi:phosphopantothenoylcysteine decarboxylase/phosphopantothenate--cysteine ligase